MTLFICLKYERFYGSVQKRYVCFAGFMVGFCRFYGDRFLTFFLADCENRDLLLTFRVIVLEGKGSRFFC